MKRGEARETNMMSGGEEDGEEAQMLFCGEGEKTLISFRENRERKNDNWFLRARMSRASRSPILGDVERPLELEMLVLIIIHKGRDGVVVAAC